MISIYSCPKRTFHSELRSAGYRITLFLTHNEAKKKGHEIHILTVYPLPQTQFNFTTYLSELRVCR